MDEILLLSFVYGTKAWHTVWGNRKVRFDQRNTQPFHYLIKFPTALRDTNRRGKTISVKALHNIKHCSAGASCGEVWNGKKNGNGQGENPEVNQALQEWL